MQKNAHARIVNGAVLLVSASVALFLDLLTKALIFPKMGLFNETGFFVGNRFLAFTAHANRGATFDAVVPVPVLIAVSSAFLIGAGVLFFRHPEWSRNKVTVTFAGLLVGGAVGNLYDRAALGYVRDWIMLFRTSILNLADMFIIIGCFGLLKTISFAKRSAARKK